MTASADLLVRVKGDTSQASSALGKLGSGLGGVAKLAGTAAVGAGVAIGAVAAKGVADFAGFQKGMQEVFTLMPGISADSMGAMSDDVLTLSKKMGIMPDEIIPALYDSISAGVPPGSVFEFLETAGKASIGGVTDLGTAVDGITSTVNAYGAEAVNAAEASDIMFTAVKLGKTTMEELSSSLFQVNPIAAGLGVKFGDVGASLAVLTAQGVPTRVAATQVRSALAELGKTGTKASDVFKDLSGKTFKDFIAGGGSMEDAFQIMKGGAADMGLEVTDLFGSIEAGQAVMALTSENGAKAFTKAMKEMENASGATDTAFGTMDQGLSRTWDKIKAQGSAALLEIGAAVAPFVQQFADWFMGVLPGAIDWFTGAIETAKPILQEIGEQLGIWVPRMVGFLTDAFNLIAPVVADVFGTVRKVIETVVGWFSSDEGGGKITKTTSGIVDGFRSFLEDVRPIFEQIVGVISGAVEVISTVVELTLGGIMALWENHGASILSFLSATWEAVRALISGALAVIKGIIDVVMGILSGDWSRVWDGIRGIVKGAWDAIVSVVQLALQSLGLLVRLALDGLGNLIGLAWNGIKTAAGAAWSGITDKVSSVVSGIWGRITGAVSSIRTNLVSSFKGAVASAAQQFASIPGKVWSFLTQIPGKIYSAISSIKSKAIELGKALIDGIIGGLGNIASALTSKLKSGISSAIRSVKSFFGIHSPSTVMMEKIGEPLAMGITGPAEDALGFAKNLSGQIPALPVRTGGTGEAGISVTVNGNLFGAATIPELVEILRNELSRQYVTGAA